MEKLKSNPGPSAGYLPLLGVQATGALVVVSRELPDFRQLVLYPGEQLPYLRGDDFAMIGTLIAMQAAYWYRLRFIPIPFHGSSAILSHLFLFLGRLTFVFGGSMFAVVFFRHLPELANNADAWLMAQRGLLLVGSLFALFCTTRELERLGHAVGSSQEN
jgi:hypothetical protein